MRKSSFVSVGLVCGLFGFLVSCGEEAADTFVPGGASGTGPTGGVSGTAAVTGGTGGSFAGTPGTGGAVATGGALATGGIAGTAGQGGAAGLAAGQGGTFAGSAGASSGFGGVGGAVAGSGGEPFGGAGSGGATAGTGGGGASTGGAGGSGGKACGTPGATFAQVQTIIGTSCGTSMCHPNAQGQHINLHNTDGMLYTRLMGNVPTAATDMQCRNRPLVVPCSPDTSLIVQMIEAASGPRAGCAIRMPDDCPGDRPCLMDADIQTIRSWIAGGAPQ